MGKKRNAPKSNTSLTLQTRPTHTHTSNK